MLNTIQDKSGTISFQLVLDNISDSIPVTFSQFKVASPNTPIIGISPNTTVSAFKSMISASDDSLKVVDANGNEVTSGQVGTGMKLQVMVNGSATDTQNIVIYGDVNGDGSINLSYLVSIRNNIIGTYTLNGLYESAGDLYGENNITLNDLVGIMSAISGTGSINQSP